MTIGQKTSKFFFPLCTQCSEFIRTTGIRATNGYWQMGGRVRNSARFVRCITGQHLILIRPFLIFDLIFLTSFCLSLKFTHHITFGTPSLFGASMH